MSTQTTFGWSAEVQRHRETFLNRLLTGVAAVGLAALILNYLSLDPTLSPLGRLKDMWPFTLGWLITVVAWAWRGLGYRPRALLAIAIVYLLGIVTFRRGGLPGSGRVWMLVLPVVTFILLGPRPGLLAGIISIVTYGAFAIIFSQEWLIPTMLDEEPNALGTWGSEGASFLTISSILVLLLWSFTRGWLEALTGIGAANEELRARTRELEETAARLHRQTSQLQTTAEIAHAGSSILEPERLAIEVVNQMEESLRSAGVYHASLFLLEKASSDARQQVAAMKAATGEAGRLLLDMGYKLELDETTAVSWSIVNQQARVAEVEEGTAQVGSIPMPHTRSEIALPLRSRGRVIGAVAIHSTKEAAFDDSDVVALQTMADQIALAIDNAQLFSQTETALEELRTTQQRYLAEAWGTFLAIKPIFQVDHVHPGTVEGDGKLLREARRAALMHGRTVAIDDSAVRSDQTDPEKATAGVPSVSPGQAALVVPVQVGGQSIGTIALHEPRHRRAWNTADITLVETIAQQVAQTVENLRLVDEVQRRAARERLTREITDKMRRASSVEGIVQTAVDEIFSSMGTSRAFVRLVPSPPHPDDDGEGT